MSDKENILKDEKGIAFSMEVVLSTGLIVAAISTGLYYYQSLSLATSEYSKDVSTKRMVWSITTSMVTSPGSVRITEDDSYSISNTTLLQKWNVIDDNERLGEERDFNLENGIIFPGWAKKNADGQLYVDVRDSWDFSTPGLTAYKVQLNTNKPYLLNSDKVKNVGFMLDYMQKTMVSRTRDNIEVKLKIYDGQDNVLSSNSNSPGPTIITEEATPNTVPKKVKYYQTEARTLPVIYLHKVKDSSGNFTGETKRYQGLITVSVHMGVL